MDGHPSGYLKGCNCERCAAIRQRARERSKTYRRPNPDARRKYKTEKQRQYDDRPGAREKRNERRKARYQQWRGENPLPPRPPKMPRISTPSKRHGGPDEWGRMYEAQQGLCYLCLRPLSANRSQVHVDHDHSCCDPGPKGRNTDSCTYCRRGLVHERCNQIWGLAQEDPELLRVMAKQGAMKQAEVRERIASKAVTQFSLFGDAEAVEL